MPTSLRDQSLPSHVLRAHKYVLAPSAENTSRADTKRTARWGTIVQYSGHPNGIAKAFEDAGVTKRHLRKLEVDGQLLFETSEPAGPSARKTHRPPSGGSVVSPQVETTIALLTNRYGGVQSADSGHKVGMRIVFTFPQFHLAQVLIPMNSRRASAYIRAYSLDGCDMSPELPNSAVKARYPGPRNAVSTLNVAKTPYLVPSEGNPILLVSLDGLDHSSLVKIFDRYFAVASDPESAMAAPGSEEPSQTVDGFGRLRDKERRRAVELHAMQRALEHYQAEGFTCLPRGKPFDLLCTRGATAIHVEVKGTTTPGVTVCLTKNEVLDARDGRWESQLFVVANIQLHRYQSKWHARGGTSNVLKQWSPSEEHLVPTEYVYSVPKP